MSLNTSQQSLSSVPPKRPRLSLQIKTPATAQTLGKSATALKADIDLSSPTASNTLSNAYAVTIQNASRAARPLSTSLDTNFTSRTSLRLETSNFSNGHKYAQPTQPTQTPGPFSITYPDTPSSAYPSLKPTTSTISSTSTQPQLQVLSEPKQNATSFTFTPPQSAGSSSNHCLPRIFTFTANSPSTSSPSTPRTPRRRIAIGSQTAPYTHPRSLHSILRNSPLPPRSTITPATPSRISMRLTNRAGKKVGYNDPLTQTITTNKYVKSHIDLLSEDGPYSATIDSEAGAGPSSGTGEKPGPVDLTMAYTGDETRDGGQTPGPFEEMRRRMAESDLETPGTRKRKRREKKRKWEWTISTSTEKDYGGEAGEGDDTPICHTPVTASRRGVLSVSEDSVSEVSEAEERFVPPSSEDSEMEGSGEWNGSLYWEQEPEPEADLHRMAFDDCDMRPSTSQSL